MLMVFTVKIPTGKPLGICESSYTFLSATHVIVVTVIHARQDRSLIGSLKIEYSQGF
jgi:hypothetical protein